MPRETLTGLWAIDDVLRYTVAQSSTFQNLVADHFGIKTITAAKTREHVHLQEAYPNIDASDDEQAHADLHEPPACIIRNMQRTRTKVGTGNVYRGEHVYDVTFLLVVPPTVYAYGRGNVNIWALNQGAAIQNDMEEMSSTGESITGLARFNLQNSDLVDDVEHLDIAEHGYVDSEGEPLQLARIFFGWEGM